MNLDAVLGIWFRVDHKIKTVAASSNNRSLRAITVFHEAGILGIICILLLGGMLVAGLSPFHGPANEVTWLKEKNGLRFGQHGTVIARSTITQTGSIGQSFSIEIWVQPQKTDDSSTLVAFYQREEGRRFSVRQNGADLELLLELQKGKFSTTSSRIYADDLFQGGRPAFLTVVSGILGTAVYLDGSLVKSAPWFRVPKSAISGQLVLGTSPVKTDSCTGQSRGLAIYGYELSAARILQHYQRWINSGRPAPEVGETERPMALYLFNEHAGKVVHDLGSLRMDLIIPEKYTILQEKFLEPPWEEFNLHLGYGKSALINVGGFIPFGFFVYAYLSRARHLRRATLATIVAGAAVSLTIEVLQSWLP